MVSSVFEKLTEQSDQVSGKTMNHIYDAAEFLSRHQFSNKWKTGSTVKEIQLDNCRAFRHALPWW